MRAPGNSRLQESVVQRVSGVCGIVLSCGATIPPQQQRSTETFESILPATAEAYDFGKRVLAALIEFIGHSRNCNIAAISGGYCSVSCPSNREGLSGTALGGSGLSLFFGKLAAGEQSVFSATGFA
jgi:hypothetical protein